MNDDKKSTINKKQFEKFLKLLDDDRDTAGKKYESIRIRIIKMLLGRGCPIAEELADESLDRVIRKVDQIADAQIDNWMSYCYGVAKHVFHEYLRKPKGEALPETIVQVEKDLTKTELDHQCLTECLNKLSPEQRELIMAYYVGEKRAKIEKRKALEQKLGISNESLRIRAFRIRKVLHDCILNCIKQNSHETL
jgi:RNA polymerase sigma factor (sigma-70 family)